MQPDIALGAVRFSLGRWTTAEEIDRAALLVGERVRGTQAVCLNAAPHRWSGAGMR